MLIPLFQVRNETRYPTASAMLRRFKGLQARTDSSYLLPPGSTRIAEQRQRCSAKQIANSSKPPVDKAKD